MRNFTADEIINFLEGRLKEAEYNLEQAKARTYAVNLTPYMREVDIVKQMIETFTALKTIAKIR